MAYLSLSTANLPDPVIDPAQGSSPEDYFDTALYTGTQAAKSINDLSFQPDWVWIKSRSSAGQPALFDVLRGVSNLLSTDRTNAEDDSNQQMLTSFDDDGFSLGNDSLTSATGVTYVAWNWKANGTGVSNTDGSITSTVSANTTSGFSIVSYSGNGTAGATVGHGLDQKPQLFILKARNGVREWPVYSETLGATKFLLLNGTNAATTAIQPFNNTEPTNQVFTVGSSNSANDSALNYIAYCFHSVEGFSKCSSYVGNGSADGPFVYTGFRPAFVLAKNASAGWNWMIWDSARDTYNQTDGVLLPNSSNAEYDVNNYMSIDMLSNGFKLRTSDSQENGSGNTFIYMAFAEQPMKFSNAR